VKQVLQNIKSGETLVADVPVPAIDANSVLIRTSKTLISAGTERMAVDFGRAGWLDKARQQPDKVRMALEKVKTDGLLQTIDAITSKLDQPLALGYCNVGEVRKAGAGVTAFKTGDRVVSNGQHAEIVCVPKNLCAVVPGGVPDDHAVFTVGGAIGLQGVRLAQPTLGECVVVTGLGLIGLLTVQILRSHGCRVLGLDFDVDRLALAETFGAETVNLGQDQDPLPAAKRFSRGHGVDAVIITASSKSNEPVSQAAKMCRKRGRIVLVGVTGLQLSRADFYEKELSFQVSCSYGPGRYDKAYEEEGKDYPIGFVRWTEQRNFEAVLDLMGSGQLQVAPLITHRFPVSDAVKAYDTLASDKSAVGIVLDFDVEESGNAAADSEVVRAAPVRRDKAEPVVGVIGAGNHSGRMLMPGMHRAGANLRTLVSSGGVSAVHYGKKFGVGSVASDASVIFDDPDITLVVVATRHDSHADYVLRAVEANKNVFVEKPLCLTLDELASIESASADSPGILVVGFNRRFSPLVVKMRELVSASSAPKSLIMTVNAGGAIPADHWTRDRKVGGGRIIGEACHFIDLLRHIVGCPIVDASITSAGTAGTTETIAESAMISLKFSDGSIGAIQYLTNGSKRFPKERLEVFVDGKALRLDNFRRLDGWGWRGFRREKLWRQDKGQQACIDALLRAIRNGDESPIPVDEILEVSRVTIELAEAAR
jgi:predicted dehydrogenase/threonine dehydrogenase-like Zn-dependent dehydrogenase